MTSSNSYFLDQACRWCHVDDNHTTSGRCNKRITADGATAIRDRLKKRDAPIITVDGPVNKKIAQEDTKDDDGDEYVVSATSELTLRIKNGFATIAVNNIRAFFSASCAIAYIIAKRGTASFPSYDVDIQTRDRHPQVIQIAMVPGEHVGAIIKFLEHLITSNAIQE